MSKSKTATAKTKQNGAKATETNGHKAASGTSKSPKSDPWWLPLPHVLDVRSLALFRILFGILQLIDVADRLKNGKYDLAWYTSMPPERSYIPLDLEYREAGFLSQFFLFRRGTAEDELLFFAVYTVLLIFFTIGYQCQKGWLLPLIWCFVNAFNNKSEDLTFGSDQLASQLTMILCCLPLSEVWSVDAFLRRKRGLPQDERYSGHQVRSVACLGLTLQILMMYMECFFVRTVDTFTWDQLHRSDWLWPDFPLVHWCANGSGTYNNLFTKIVRETVWLNQAMTISGFLIELSCPLFCFLLNQRYSHLFAVNLILLHFGIGQILAIPHFAWMGMLIHTIWIPTHVWDRLLGRSSQATYDENVAIYKKTDGDDEKTRTVIQATVVPETNVFQTVISFMKRSVALLFSCLYVYLLVVTFSYDRGWFRKYPNVNKVAEFSYSLGEELWFQNSWGMWSPGAVHESPYTVLLGWRENDQGEQTHFNIYHFIRTGGEEVEFGGFTDEYLDNSTYDYPTTRWEKSIGDEYESTLLHPETSLSESLGIAICHLVNQDLVELGRPRIDFVEVKIHLRELGTIGSGKRYGERERTGGATQACVDVSEDSYDEDY